MTNDELKKLMIPKEQELVIMIGLYLLGKVLELIQGES